MREEQIREVYAGKPGEIGEGKVREVRGHYGRESGEVKDGVVRKMTNGVFGAGK